MNTTAAYNGLSEWIWSLALYVLKKTVFANTNVFIEYLKFIQMTTIKKLYLFCWKVIKTNRTFIGFLGFVWLKWRLLFWNAQFGAILQDEIKKELCWIKYIRIFKVQFCDFIWVPMRLNEKEKSEILWNSEGFW